MSVGKALALVETALAYPGEQTGGLDGLNLDGLLELSTTLGRVATAARAVRVEVDEAAAAVLGPGVAYEYGDQRVSWSHGWKWKPYETAAEFVVAAVTADPTAVLDLFSLGSIRKTGIERAAKKMGLDPDLVVGTVLAREYEREPRLVWKPVALSKGEPNE